VLIVTSIYSALSENSAVNQTTSSYSFLKHLIDPLYFRWRGTGRNTEKDVLDVPEWLTDVQAVAVNGELTDHAAQLRYLIQIPRLHDVKWDHTLPTALLLLSK